MLANSLIELDRAHLIHPVSSYRGHEALGVRVLKSAKGATVTDASGRQLVDGFAGLWCVNAGYGHDMKYENDEQCSGELHVWFGHLFVVHVSRAESASGCRGP